jgi:hypothetical protein
MHGAALRAIKHRVEKLAAACQVTQQLTFVHWENPYDTCPSCGYDLNEHARACPREAAGAPAIGHQRSSIRSRRGPVVA